MVINNLEVSYVEKRHECFRFRLFVEGLNYIFIVKFVTGVNMNVPLKILLSQREAISIMVGVSL